MNQQSVTARFWTVSYSICVRALPSNTITLKIGMATARRRDLSIHFI